MSEQFTEQEVQLNETQEQPVTENSIPAEDTAPVENVEAVAKPKSKKKKIAIIGVIAIVAIAVAIFCPSKFERVKTKCVHIAGQVTGSGDYFMIDTYPDHYKNMDDLVVSIMLPDTQENALEAIRYANEELGFNGSVYSNMLRTSALMGRQSAENDKYRVSWTYHPDDGLEVTYEKK